VPFFVGIKRRSKGSWLHPQPDRVIDQAGPAEFSRIMPTSLGFAIDKLETTNIAVDWN
jgi:protoheme ferro-lyase